MRKKTEALALEIATQATTREDVNGLMRTLLKLALQRMLDTELNVHLGRTQQGGSEPVEASEPSTPASGQRDGKNRRNGHSPKTLQGEMGKLPLEIPRDRHSTFQPQRIGKSQRRLAGFDEKILALYATGMTTRDIQDIVKELYGVDVSPTLVSEITADLDAEVKLWQSRRLDPVWPIPVPYRKMPQSLNFHIF